MWNTILKSDNTSLYLFVEDNQSKRRWCSSRHFIRWELVFGLAFSAIAVHAFLLPDLGFGTVFFGNMSIPTDIPIQRLPRWAIAHLLVLFSPRRS